MKAIYNNQEHTIENLTQYSVQLEGIKKSLSLSIDKVQIIKQPLPPNSIIQVIGRRWFERTNGNTYHSATLIVNGDTIGHEPFAYGYGSQYEQTARAILLNAFTIEGLDNLSPMWSICDQGHKFNSNATDVQRKKDL